MAGMQHTLSATITKNRAAVTDLQPYLDTYAHLTAFPRGATWPSRTCTRRAA